MLVDLIDLSKVLDCPTFQDPVTGKFSKRVFDLRIWYVGLKNIYFDCDFAIKPSHIEYTCDMIYDKHLMRGRCDPMRLSVNLHMEQVDNHRALHGEPFCEEIKLFIDSPKIKIFNVERIKHGVEYK